MNCKPGDLAIYVGHAKSLHGFVFRCIERASFGGEPAWMTHPPPPPSPTNEYVSAGIVMDASLRPIRNPGEDAQDESRAWLPPVPTQHKETAE